MHIGLTKGFEITTIDNEGWVLFGNMADYGSYAKTQFNMEINGLVQNDTCRGICTADK